MSVIVRVICAADGITPTPHDGRYITAWDPHTEAGTLVANSTDDPREAKRWPSLVEAMEEWKTVSRIQPLRPWDFQPNRPLAALTVEVVRAPL